MRTVQLTINISIRSLKSINVIMQGSTCSGGEGSENSKAKMNEWRQFYYYVKWVSIRYTLYVISWINTNIALNASSIRFKHRCQLVYIMAHLISLYYVESTNRRTTNFLMTLLLEKYLLWTGEISRIITTTNTYIKYMYLIYLFD